MIFYIFGGGIAVMLTDTREMREGVKLFLPKWGKELTFLGKYGTINVYIFEKKGQRHG